MKFSQALVLSSLVSLSFARGFSTNDVSGIFARQNNGRNRGNNIGGNTNNAATGATDNPATSTCLVSSVINTGSENDGTGNASNKFSIASATSANNFINECAVNHGNLAITNGIQVTDSTCNPIPMGVIPSINNLPASKFTFPQNFGTINSNETFSFKLKIKNLQAGAFTSAAETYYAAPCTTNANGDIIGHVHIVAQKLASIDSADILDPTTFAFFLGVDDAADANSELSALVTGGLAPGAYRVSTITSCMNHQVINGPKAQRGTFEDSVYFTVADNGNSNTGDNTGNTGNNTGNTGNNTDTGNTGNGNNNADTGSGKNNGSGATCKRRRNRAKRLAARALDMEMH